MNTLYFYKTFLRKVRSHLGVLAHLTGPLTSIWTAPWCRFELLWYRLFYRCCLFMSVLRVNLIKDTLENINNNIGDVFYKNWIKTASLSIKHFQKVKWVKTFSKCLKLISNRNINAVYFFTMKSTLNFKLLTFQILRFMRT